MEAPTQEQLGGLREGIGSAWKHSTAGTQDSNKPCDSSSSSLVYEELVSQLFEVCTAMM